MTVWMDFNPINYFGRDFSLFVGGGFGFVFLWRGSVYVFEVVLRFKDSSVVFVLYDRFYPLQFYPEDDSEDF